MISFIIMSSIILDSHYSQISIHYSNNQTNWDCSSNCQVSFSCFINHRPQFNLSSKPTEILHQIVKYHSRFFISQISTQYSNNQTNWNCSSNCQVSFSSFISHRPQLNQSPKPKKIVSRRKHNRIIVLGFGAGQTANRLFGVVSAIVVSMILDIPIACSHYQQIIIRWTWLQLWEILWCCWL